MSTARWWSHLGTGYRRWWNRFSGAPARALMDRLVEHVPTQQYDGLRFVVTDEALAHDASRFFDRTRAALRRISADAPDTFEELSRDVEQVVFTTEGDVSYQPFQLAIVVRPVVLNSSDELSYAAWLLQASAGNHGAEVADARVNSLLETVTPDERERVESWLDSNPAA